MAPPGPRAQLPTRRELTWAQRQHVGAAAARGCGLRRRALPRESGLGIRSEASAGSTPGGRGSGTQAGATTARLQRLVGVSGPFASFQVRIPKRMGEAKGTA